MYFHMDGCRWCDKFNDTWAEVKKEIKGVTFTKINGPENRDKVRKYGVTSYPALVKVVGGRDKLLKADSPEGRSLKKIKEFLKGVA